MTNVDCGNLLMSEKSCCAGIKLVNGCFYAAAAPDWSHKHTQRRGSGYKWRSGGSFAHKILHLLCEAEEDIV